jgi:hypothetical protein
MASTIVESLLIEQVEIFKQAFLLTSKSLFYDSNGKLAHPGEYGVYREAICKDFLRFFIPGNLDITNGFVIDANNNVSTQADIIIYDPEVTPLIQSENRQRFFPIETVCGVGEVKSIVDKSALKDAINKLSKFKEYRTKIKNPSFLKRSIKLGDSPFDPINFNEDQIFTFLICHRFDFNLSNLAADISTLYDQNLYHGFKHNLILSIEDGLLLYYYNDPTLGHKNLMHPVFRSVNLKNNFLTPGQNKYTHFNCFANYIFQMATGKTILYPELSDYISFAGGFNNKEP